MRNHIIGFIGSVAIAMVAVQAQAPKSAIKRLADGHPDLQGLYDVATMTPVDRPRGVKNLVLTEQEAAAMEKYEAQRQVKNDAPLAGDRSAPPVGGESTQPKTYLEFLVQAGGGGRRADNQFWLGGGRHVLRVGGETRRFQLNHTPVRTVRPTH